MDQSSQQKQAVTVLEDTSEYWESLSADCSRSDEWTLGPSRTPHGKFADLKTTMLSDLVCSDIRMVDLGAGYGKYTIPMAQLGAKIVSVDLSPFMIHKLRLNLNNNHLDVDVIRADLRCLPFRPRVFDGAVYALRLSAVFPDIFGVVL